MNNTGFKMYDRGPLGRLQRTTIERAATTPTYQSIMDFFLLNVDRVVEICDGNNERVKIISFSFLDRTTAIPVFG